VPLVQGWHSCGRVAWRAWACRRVWACVAHAWRAWACRRVWAWRVRGICRVRVCAYGRVGVWACVAHAYAWLAHVFEGGARVGLGDLVDARSERAERRQPGVEPMVGDEREDARGERRRLRGAVDGDGGDVGVCGTRQMRG
jgi:hypothetical protein